MDFNDKRKLDTSRVKILKNKKPDSRGMQLIKAAKKRLQDLEPGSKEYFQTKTIAGPSDWVSEARRDKAHASNNKAKRKFKNS